MTATNDEMWRKFLTGTDPDLLKMNRLMRRLPKGPRCKMCGAPFSSPGKYLVRPFGFSRWAANPSMCGICAKGLDKSRGGAEVEATFLFADIRGSTGIAERTSAADYHALLDGFYTAAGMAVDDAGGLVDKYMGDGVVALFVPAFSPDRAPAAAAIEAARTIIATTGRAGETRRVLPVGVGVHTGPAFVGVMGTEGGQLDFTGVGDTVNIAARLGSVAEAGEILVSSAALEAAGLEPEGLQSKRLELKGRGEPVDVYVVAAGAMDRAGGAGAGH